MKLKPTIEAILDKALAGKGTTKEEAVELLSTELNSSEMYALMSAANTLSRRQSNNRGEIYGQIGINFWPCPKSCDFCSLGEKTGLITSPLEFDAQEVVARAKAFEASGANAVFLMTTADYPFDRFIEIAKAVREAISPTLPLVANIGDFGSKEAEVLLDAGFQGVYHVFRLREGRDTRIPLEERLATLEAIRNSALDLSYCVEPIGPEHPAEDLVMEMFRGLQYEAVGHACMRRTPVPGTPLAKFGEISELEMAKFVAVTRLVAGGAIRVMGVHEPSLLSLMAGANIIFAEVGPNPRDTKEDTAAGRGRTVEQCRRMLWEAGWAPLEGPTQVFRGRDKI
jgi:biotin synthase